MMDILLEILIMIVLIAIIDFIGTWILKPFYTYSDKKNSKDDE